MGRSGLVRLAQLDDLVGAYLHGSWAMGGFYRPNSDVDLLVVTETAPKTTEQSRLTQALLSLFDERPIAGGVELSVMTRDVVETFEHPSPYAYQFSEGWVDELRAGRPGPSGNDPDLAAHCTVVRSGGVALVGPSPVSIFADVPRAAYLDAILGDLRSIICLQPIGR